MSRTTRPPEFNREIRGHDFYPKPEDNIPPLYAQDSRGQDATVYVHYFAPFVDIYLTEYEPETGTGFGWVCLNGDLDNAELGYVDLPMYESIRPAGTPMIVEKDLHFEPKSLRECIAEARSRLGG